jgi:lipopolysaccharide transport protein LptA
MTLWPITAPQCAQPAPDVRAKDFSLPFFDESDRLKYLVHGEAGETVLAKGQLQVTQFRLESYSTNKELELIISAPECLYNINTQSAGSPGPLEIQSADGQLRIAGEGFLWRQTNASLIISNRVQSFIRRGMSNAPAGPGKAPARPAVTNAPIKITSDHFQFDIQAKVVVYEDHVRVDDPEMELTCGWLMAKLRAAGGGVETILARQNVKIVNQQDESEATADEAVYTESTDQVELSGNAAWRQGVRSGKADRLVLNRRDKEFSAQGHAVVQFPREAASQMGLLLTPLARTNSPINPTGLVEAFADSFHSRSNVTVLRGNVRLLDSTNSLTCGLLTLESATADDLEETATAEQDVMVEQGNRRVWADRAVHSKSAQTVVFSGNPRWNLDQREGKADSLVLNLKDNVAHAAQHVYVRIPRAPGGQRLDLLPRFGAEDSPAVSGDQALEISADDLDLRSSVATFGGQVRANQLPPDEAQPRMTCGLLTIKFTSPSNQIEQIGATRDVTIEQGTRGVTNGAVAWQKFVCDALTAQVRPETGLLSAATAQGNVVVERDLLRATGSEAFYAAENRTLELSGNPQLTTPQFVITEAEALLWNLASNKYSARGSFKMTLFPEARNQPGPFKLKKNQTAQFP